ncbi:MAG: DUF1223 domain-containing protein [Asticcacaulis sp.]|uniref:DUF1223 domain-containing protein n=1 Tax=Asticcacaulis sp. TaxID=1872648 RepID=UPI003F7BE5CF
MQRLIPILTLILSACAPAIAQPQRPVVVELFTSQGCSSCPPAHAVLNALADEKNVLPLSFSVTYWDNLGWKDTFGNPAYTQRQWDYARGLRHANVYTPQMVIDGFRDTPGQNLKPVEALIARARTEQTPGPQLTLNADQVSLSAAPAGGASSGVVWLIRYDPRLQNVAVGRGENGGRTLPQRNVVRQLLKLGDWNGKATSFSLQKASDARFKTAILVQQDIGGPILAAATN